MPRVSVVIPAYNSAQTIAQTVASVQAQAFGDWEIVLCDDASTDRTVEVVGGLDEPRLRIVTSPANAGPAAARNRALAQACGELIGFLDADDLWDEDYLGRQVSRYDAERQRPERLVGIVACNARLADQDGSIERHSYLDLFGRRRLEPITVERLLRRNTIYISALVPRAIGEQVGWFDTSLFGTEDHDLWIKIVERGHRVVLERTPLATYRRTATSISRNTARQALNNQRTLRAALSRGRLTPRQRRVARSELHYNRALETVASALTGQRPGWRQLPELAWVFVTRPGQWKAWAAAVRRP